MSEGSRIDEYIDAHPREFWRLVVIISFFVLNSMACVIGVFLYFSLVHALKVDWWKIVGIGATVFISMGFVEGYFYLQHIDLTGMVKVIVCSNGVFWRRLLAGSLDSSFVQFYLYQGMSLPILMAGIIALIDKIPVNQNIKILRAIHEGSYSSQVPELVDGMINKALKGLKDEGVNGTVLGVSKYTGKAVVIPDRDINQIVLVLGTTGGGKTVTLRRFYKRAIVMGYPLVIVDGKPDGSNIEWVRKLAEEYNRPFFGFNCGNYYSYDPLASGGYTELKDKIISLKDEWSSDHYRSIAEDYLQTVFEVLLKVGRKFDLKSVVDYLNYDCLTDLARASRNEELMARVARLEGYDQKDITGLQAHLNILIHSELGQYFLDKESIFNLNDVIGVGGIVYFSLPALRFPSFSKVLGKLVINDLKAVIDRNEVKDKKVFTIFDEFSVFAGEQVLNLVNMGRGKGVHAIFGTQGLADLDRVDEAFKSQVMNCANTLICHRLNDQVSAETVASWVGTADASILTAQLSTGSNNQITGSVRHGKEFVIHPDQIKQELRTGEAFWISKVNGFGWQKIKVISEDS